PAAAAAALFGLAPLHAQSVAWATAIPLPLSAAFELAALLWFLDREHTAIRHLAMSLGAFALAMLSHESAVVFPAVIAASVLLLEPSAPDESALDRARRAALEAAPYFALLALYLAVRFRVLGFISRPAPHNSARWVEVALSIPAALANYLAILALPWLAGPAHPFELVSKVTSPEFYLPTIGLIALGCAGYLLLRKSERRNTYLFLIVWMLLGLAPVLNLRSLVTDGFIEDRYLYLPSAAAFILLADIAASLAKSRDRGRLVVAAGMTVLTLYALILWRVESYWHDEVALFSRCIEQYPASPLCHGRLAMAFERQGNLRAAELEYHRSLQVNPEDLGSLYDLGRLHARNGQAREGETEISRALAGMPNMPAELYVELAQIAEEAHDGPGAEQALEQAAKIDPRAVDPADVVRAEMAANDGNFTHANEILETLIQRAPNYADGWAALGTLLTRENQPDEGLADVEKAVKLAPDDVMVRLQYARVLHQLGRDREALGQCRRILAAEPTNQSAAHLYGQIIGSLAGDATAP
ncbi:MAG TPA: tetratricopeptide repeat protein, partial [Candidatus Binataceae bacterium]|nr:tetratricopeptide repeat protein [Candidatus Binataceae bacterium]